MKNKIIKAAILLDGVIYTGKRHCNIIHDIVENGGEKPVKGIQGFVDSKGKFYDRNEAALFVIETKQIKSLNWPPLLYSEDLY